MDVVSDETRAQFRNVHNRHNSVQKLTCQDSQKSELAACKTLASSQNAAEPVLRRRSRPEIMHPTPKVGPLRHRRENPPKTNLTRTRTAPDTKILELCLPPRPKAT